MKWENVLSTGLMALILGSILFVLSFALSLTEFPRAVRKEKTIRIPSGSTLREAAQLLRDEHVIPGVERFLILAKLRGVETKVRAGEYRFHTRMLPSEVLDRLMVGEEALESVTIPEGYTLVQIADLLEQKGLTLRGRFLEIARDPHFVASVGVEGNSVEGFAFPDTYRLRRGMDEADILRMMIARFGEIYGEDFARRQKELGFRRSEVVTLASMIEKETAIAPEKPFISAVFHNRLGRGMRLESDPTVIYGLKDFDGNLRREDLQVDSPFNTYVRKGLPPGPIANPGRDSIWASLSPAPVDYLFFVSKNDGSHHFSTTLAEHNRAVQRYQRSRRRVRGP
jgi:UPF0755 protein